MNSVNALQTATEAAESAILLDTSSQIARAAKAWSRSSVLGVDTEFVRERTYYANLGLVQISDGQTVWLVDPLVDGAAEPLKALLENQNIIKLVHSPSEDLDVLNNSLGAVPQPMVDTQLACALAGQSVQMAYHAAVQWLLGVEVAKDQTRSNWVARPLRAAQLHYAALDVSYLPLMWQTLEQQLQTGGRLEWLMEDCQAMLDKATTGIPDTNSWQRIRGAARLDGPGLAILQSLAGWRENEARQRNQPRGFVVSDSLLLAISHRRCTTIQALSALEGFHPRAIQRHGPEIIRQVTTILKHGNELPVIEPLTGAQNKQLKVMRQYVVTKASARALEPTLLASKKDLEELLRNGGAEWPQKLQGWRQQVLGPGLLESTAS